MQELLSDISIAMAAVDALLSGGLLLTYVRIFLRVRTRFTAGLITFAAAFMAQSILTTVMYVFFMPIIPDVLSTPLMAAIAFESVGLGVMLLGSQS